MLPLHLSDQIMEFVEAFRVVEERQVMQFFKEPWGKLKVQYELNHLKSKSMIFEHRANPRDENEPVKLSSVRTLRTPIREYQRTIAAVAVLCKYRCDEINFFTAMRFPSEILFVTTGDIIYEVSVFDTTNFVGKLALTPSARDKRLPDGEQDPTNYIAVLPLDTLSAKGDRVMVAPHRQKMFKAISELGFSMYATVDRENHAEIYEA